MKTRRIILISVQICCFLVIIYSAYKIKINLKEYRAGEAAYSDLENKVNEVSKDELESQINYSLETQEDNKVEKFNFEQLQEINPEIIGWIKSKDGSINYPITQGDDNSFYLTHLYDGTENSAGCIFLDCRNDSTFSDKNSIIYGHNMNNGSMFASLLNYKEEKYFFDNNELYIVTPEKNYVVKVFSCYDSDIRSNSWDMNFNTDTVYENWLHEIRNKSLWKNDISPKFEDKIVTLSTCNNNSWDNRFVVHGILSEN